MKWTTTKPTEPGHYWERWDGDSRLMTVIQVMRDKGNGKLYVASGGASHFTAEWSLFTAGPNNVADPEWAGPIQLPTEGESHGK